MSFDLKRFQSVKTQYAQRFGEPPAGVLKFYSLENRLELMQQKMEDALQTGSPVSHEDW